MKTVVAREREVESLLESDMKEWVKSGRRRTVIDGVE
jgi:hypothetical protein